MMFRERSSRQKVNEYIKYLNRWLEFAGEDKFVYLDENTREVLMKYLAVRNNKDSPYVFTTSRGKISPVYMGKIAQRISLKTGVKFSWHKSRHTYAKNLMGSDVDLQTISQMLGHERLDTTAIYSVLDTEEALERVQEEKPRFYRESERYKSPKSWDSLHGLAGIQTVKSSFGGI